MLSIFALHSLASFIFCVLHTSASAWCLYTYQYVCLYMPSISDTLIMETSKCAKSWNARKRFIHFIYLVYFSDEEDFFKLLCIFVCMFWIYALAVGNNLTSTFVWMTNDSWSQKKKTAESKKTKVKEKKYIEKSR